jgi:hypothetical protein
MEGWMNSSTHFESQQQIEMSSDLSGPFTFSPDDYPQYQSNRILGLPQSQWDSVEGSKTIYCTRNLIPISRSSSP